MKAISYGRQSITQEDIDVVVETLKSDFLTQGPKVLEFEKDFAMYVDAKYAVAVSNGTAALHLCAMALGVQSGQKIITTPITFVASANCVKYCGGDVEFVDINPENYTIDLVKLEAKLKASPRGTYAGVVPVDFAGYPCDVQKLRQLADEYGFWIIEDACHAPGGSFMDSENETTKCGNGKYSDLSIFSFHPVKHIATGEGGMISTNDEVLYKKLLSLRTHGITKDENTLEENHGGWYYEMHELGYNYRLCDMQAALGVSQLKRAEAGLVRRREIASIYNAAFQDMDIITPKVESDFMHAYHLYIIQVENRKALYEFLRENNIFAQIHYVPVHLQPFYKKDGWKKGDFSVAEAYYDKCLSLPMFPTLTQEEQNFVIDKIKEFFK